MSWRRRILKYARRALIGLAAVVLVLALLIVLTPQGRAAFRAALFIPEVLPDLAVKPQSWFSREPVLEEVAFETAAGPGVADIYRPGGDGKHGAVVFFQGVVPGGRYDPRIVALGRGLARSGMVVMIPWSETQETHRIAVEDVDVLVRAFQHLQSLDYVDPHRVGMGGICVGASLAMVAAQDERIRGDVSFVNSFAGYYDAEDFAKAIGSRSRFDEGYASPWEPDKLTYGVFRDHLIEGVVSDDDRRLLTQLYLEGKTPEGDLDQMAPDALAVRRLLDGVPHEEVDLVVAELSPATAAFFQAISPSAGIENLEARVLIMHDTADRLVPSEESRRLAGVLDEGSVYHTEFSFFQRQIQVHVGDAGEVGLLDYVREAAKLYMHMYNIMRIVD